MGFKDKREEFSTASVRFPAFYSICCSGSHPYSLDLAEGFLVNAYHYPKNTADEVIAPSVGPQPVRQFEFFNLILRGILRDPQEKHQSKALAQPPSRDASGIREDVGIEKMVNVTTDHQNGPPTLGALKQFLPPGTTGAAASAAEYGFRKERAALEQLQGHRNIVTLYGVFTIHFSPNVPSRCLLLELLDVSVSELLLYSSHQGCSMWMIQHCARDVLEALAFLHHEGYVHADLKPRNILWSAENECFKLIDFGLSFKEGNQDVKYIQTDGYRAPEAELQNCLAQAGLQSDTECTSAVDLWSLGIILLEMFSGMKLKHTVRSQEWKANSSAIIDHIFASKAVVNAAIPAYHLRDLIKSLLGEFAFNHVVMNLTAPHIEDLVMLPTPVLRLLNVLDDDYLENEEEYEDVVEDVKEECQKYGPVVSLLVPKENPGRGQVFVEYANAGDSKAAQKLLTGRMFDGKFVVATFYPLSAYKRGYLYQTLL
ncbi:Serine/threonine-protein kinase Kist [Bos mutus]|uniref:Serine/threonine-protein kinase Kist n=1 Tax=Bos mutus TaxID=72004 RepID=L8IXT0_9CETA|nr:Serine/threonine-protein kinase Kist [Bos mutus]